MLEAQEHARPDEQAAGKLANRQRAGRQAGRQSVPKPLFEMFIV